MMKFSILVITLSSFLFGQINVQHNQRKLFNNLSFRERLDTVTREDSKENLHFEFGIRDELIFMFSNEFNSQNMKFENSIKFLLPFNFHLTAGLRFLRHYKIDFRFGILAANDYIFGFDDGFYLQSGLPNSKFYGVIGVDFFNNNLASDGTTETGGNFIFYCFGLGYETSGNFSIDIIYSFPSGNKVYAKEPAGLYGGIPGQFYYKRMNGLIRLGFQYSFNF
jgi:hypothetical protein